MAVQAGIWGWRTEYQNRTQSINDSLLVLKRAWCREVLLHIAEFSLHPFKAGEVFVQSNSGRMLSVKMAGKWGFMTNINLVLCYHVNAGNDNFITGFVFRLISWWFFILLSLCNFGKLVFIWLTTLLDNNADAFDEQQHNSHQTSSWGFMYMYMLLYTGFLTEGT